MQPDAKPREHPCRASPTCHSPSAWPPPSGSGRSPCWLVTAARAQRVRHVHGDEVNELSDARRPSRSPSPASSARTCRRSAADATEHLYVYDGDLKSQDQIAGPTIEGDERRAPSAEAAKLAGARRRATPNDREASVAQATTWSNAARRGARAARAQETVAAAEDRDGSRNLYVGQDLARRSTSSLKRRSSQLQDAVARRTNSDRRRASRPAPASTSSACC